MTDVTRLKLHGAFRSGTNYVKALLELNYDVQVLATAGGWKHAPVPALGTYDHGWPIVGVVRNPWVWLTSMWSFLDGPGARHVDAGATWLRFLAGPITITDADDPNVPEYRFSSPVDYWNAMASNLVSIGARGQVVRYEDAVRNPVDACERVASGFGLTRTTEEFVRVDRRTRNMVDRPRRALDDYVTDQRFDPATAAGRPDMSRFDWRSRRLVRHQLDGGLVDRLGYGER